MSNVTEFTKAFNTMISLHGKMEKTVKIIEEGDAKIG